MPLPSRQATLTQIRNNMKAGNFPAAQQLGQQLLNANKNDSEVLNLLGSIALQQGRLEEAESFYVRAAQSQPGEAGYLVNLGKVRLQMGRLNDAAQTFDKAMKLKPGMDMAVAGKAECLNYLGEPDKARAVLEPLVRRKADGPEMAFVYGTLLQQADDDKEAIPVLTRHLADPAVNGLNRYRMGLLLGKSYEKLHRFDEAFAAYRDANAVGAASSRFNPVQHAEWIGRLIAAYTAERMKSLPRAAVDSELPIFIVGTARSGTTLIEQIIQSHPKAFGGGEMYVLDLIVGSMPRHLGTNTAYPACMASLRAESAERVANLYLEKVKALSPQSARIVDKNLRNMEHVGLVHLLFPRARIIHCKRDPLDTCISCFSSPLSPVKHGYSVHLAHLGAFYRQYERIMEHWRSLALPMLEIQYEDLVANQEEWSRKIIAYCGLDWDDQCLRYYESKRVVRTLSYDQVRRPIFDTSIGRWKNFEKHIGPLKAALEGGVEGRY